MQTLPNLTFDIMHKIFQMPKSQLNWEFFFISSNRNIFIFLKLFSTQEKIQIKMCNSHSNLWRSSIQRT